MKNILSIIFALTLSLTTMAQTVADLENLGLSQGQWLDGSDLNGGWQSGNVFFHNVFDIDYFFWTGWAISATTDTETPGFSNQFSSIAGEGAEGSTSYAVGYAFDPNVLHLTGEGTGGVVNGMFVANSTYAYLSMRDGDYFSKKFGGETGDDPDYFLLTIKGYHDGTIKADSVNYYLADYRSNDSDADFIRDEWRWVDLTSLGNVDSLWFLLRSTDVGQFGMNTPAYFCIDNLTTADGTTSTFEITQNSIAIFPNPVSNRIFTNSVDQGNVANVEIFTSSGLKVSSIRSSDLSSGIDVTGLPPGAYILRIIEGGQSRTGRFNKL